MIDTVSTIHGKLDLKYYLANGNKNNVLDVEQDVDLRCLKLLKIPLKFNEVGGFFDISNNQLKTMKNAPVSVGIQEGASFLASGNFLSSFEYSPVEVGGHYFIDENNITSLHDIHKHVKRIDYSLCIDFNKIEDSMLGILLIAGLKSVSSKEHNIVIERKLLNIINKYIKYPDNSKIFCCQKDLIDAGYEEYAKL